MNFTAWLNQRRKKSLLSWLLQIGSNFFFQKSSKIITKKQLLSQECILRSDIESAWDQYGWSTRSYAIFSWFLLDFESQYSGLKPLKLENYHTFGMFSTWAFTWYTPGMLAPPRGKTGCPAPKSMSCPAQWNWLNLRGAAGQNWFHWWPLFIRPSNYTGWKSRKIFSFDFVYRLRLFCWQK